MGTARRREMRRHWLFRRRASVSLAGADADLCWGSLRVTARRELVGERPHSEEKRTLPGPRHTVTSLVCCVAATFPRSAAGILSPLYFRPTGCTAPEGADVTPFHKDDSTLTLVPSDSCPIAVDTKPFPTSAFNDRSSNPQLNIRYYNQDLH